MTAKLLIVLLVIYFVPVYVKGARGEGGVTDPYKNVEPTLYTL
jgi:hypothetical protein